MKSKVSLVSLFFVMFLVVPLLVWTLDDPDKNALRMENGMRTVDIGRIQRFIANAGNEVFTSAKKLEEAAKQWGLSKEEIEVLLAAYRKSVEKVTEEFMQTKTGFETIRELARKENPEVGQKFDEPYKKAEKEVSSITEHKLTTAILNNYMNDKYGHLPPLERVRRTHQDLAEAQRKGTREAYEPFLKYMPVEQPFRIEKGTAGKIKEEKTTVKSERDYCSLVSAYMESEQYREAEKTALEGLKHSKDPSTVYTLYFELGTIYLITNQMDKAESVFKKMIELNPGDAVNYFNLSLVYHSTGREEEALKAFEEAIRLNPEYKKLLEP